MQLVRKVRLRVGAGAAKPGPAIGQALGPLGVNMADFCKQFNESTKNLDKDVPIPVVLSAFSNRTFSFTCKTPPTTWFLKKCADIELGASSPGHDVVGYIDCKQIYEIALVKQKDEHMKHIKLDAIARSIASSARNLGLEIIGGAGQMTKDVLPLTKAPKAIAASDAKAAAPAAKAAAPAADKAKK